MAKTIGQQVREALIEAAGRSMCEREETAMLVLSERLTEAGARRLRALIR